MSMKPSRGSSSVPYNPPPQENNPKPKQNIRVFFAPSTQDNVPIVNPTPPGSTTTPTSPSTEPITNPTTPVTTPTSPDTNPSPTIPTPTSPDTNPSPTVPTPTLPDTIPSPTVPTPTLPDTNPTPTAPIMTPPTVPTTTPSTPPSSSGGTWCVANQGASPTALQVALDYACGYGAGCSAIQTGGSCYEPDTVQNHASYAFNDYYQKHPDPTNCVFGGAAQLTNTDPSTANCHYAASSSTDVSPPARMAPPATMSPPSTTTMAPPFSMTPPTSTGPGGDTVYGSAGPTGLPNSAISVSFRFWPIYVTMSLVWSLVAANIF
ncbi:mucin-2-like [Hibiscus syriacus]|uniref:mucin-2-like n=1 Tax=Hibiscus syriacus TaxID=106335 RepID=UPI001924B623|nr:mucin-2-like [Hibiscus syriacus]